MSNLSDDILKAVESGTKVWKREKRKADNADRLSARQFENLCKQSYHKVSVREAAF